MDPIQSVVAMYSIVLQDRYATAKHWVSLVIRAQNGQKLVHRFFVEVKKSASNDELIAIRTRVSQVESDFYTGRVACA